MKVKEISSFINNFDNKYWNEIIMQLTIIGIRYISKNCNYSNLKIEDLIMIADMLKKNKTIESNLNRNENEMYNYNYNNTTFFVRKDLKDMSNKISKNNTDRKFNTNVNKYKKYKSKSLLSKSAIQENKSKKHYYLNYIKLIILFNN